MPAAARLSSADGSAIACVDRPSKDIDIEVFGIAQDRLPWLLAPFGRVEPVGQSFPVYKLVPPGGSAGEIDVALPRRESKRGRGHKGFEVHGDPSMSLVEAARRRDFTINAIAWDPLTDAYEDPFDGRADLTRRCCARSIRRPFPTTACVRFAPCSLPRASSSRSRRRLRRSVANWRLTIFRRNASGER